MTRPRLPPPTPAELPAPPRCRRRRPDVSVCIVNWNGRRMLRDCLRSLKATLQGVRAEVIVVDNGSTDGAAEMVERCFPRVVLIRNSANEGFARANNQAARLARGRFLFFLNNDTLVPPGTLRRLCDYARAHPDAGLIGPRLRDGNGRTQVSCRRKPSVPVLLHRLSLLRWTGLFRRAYHCYRCRDANPDATRPVEVLMGAALFMPRRVFLACGPWDEDYTFGGEDIDLCARVARRHAVVYHPAVEVVHYGRVSSRRRIGYAHTHTVVGIARYLRKAGCGRGALLLYKAALTLDAPVSWLCQVGQYVWRRVRGQQAKAAKARLRLQALGHFLARGLVLLWKV